jgi:single-stranded DNA-binding protein
MEMLGSNNQTQQGGYSMNSQNSGGYGQQGGYQNNQYNRPQETRPQAAPQRKQESYSEVPDIDVDADSFNNEEIPF